MLRTWIVQPDVWCCPDFLSEEETGSMMRRVDDEADWECHVIRMFGKEIPSPRLTTYQADEGVQYAYSGITLDPAEWTPAVAGIKRRVEETVGRSFNSVLLNKYRSGDDSMGWHADDEKELGDEPVIASVSLGAERRFLLRANESGEKVETPLKNGSLLVMGGRSQHDWKHSVPKTKKDVGPRINLTFRLIRATSC